MKFIRSIYPLIPGRDDVGSPCWQLTTRLFRADADWNTRFPFGVSFGLDAGSQRNAKPLRIRRGFLLDLNAPLGEPNRLYVHGPRWHITVGLISWWTFRETGREGRMIEGEYVRCRPHLDGIIRYRYHKDESGEWVRDDKPAPGHWGWLTIERTNRAIAG